MNNYLKRISTLGILVATGLSMAFAQEGARQRHTAELLAKLMVASRQIISENQKLFNDPDVGDKGFTPSAFADKAGANFKRLYGLDIKTDKTLPSEVQMLWQAMQDVVKDAQPVINKKGMAFKGFLPAVFARQSAAKFTAKVPGAYAKLTSIPDVHNKVNTPDEWEAKVLAKFLKPDYPKGTPFSEVADKGGKKMLRLIQPEYFVESCMPCHGEPKGEKGPGGVVKCGKKPGTGGAGFSIGLKVE